MVQPLTFATFRAAQNALQFQLDQASKKLETIPGHASGPMGLTPDEVKFTPRYQAARRDCEHAMAALQRLNKAHVKRFAKELRAERDARRAAKLASG